MMKFNFNTNHYIKVVSARKEAGLPVENRNIMVESNLIGKKVISTLSNETFTVQAVHRLWKNGWYEMLLLVNKVGSHSMAVWKIFNCNDQCIENLCKKSHTNWKILSHEPMER
jgi:hypothetical protein